MGVIGGIFTHQQASVCVDQDRFYMSLFLTVEEQMAIYVGFSVGV